MCRKLVVTNEIFLGTRAICYEAYSLPKGEVVELTEKQIKDALKGITTDEVYGLELSEAGELVMDKKTFFTTNMMKKIHTNTLIPMVEEDCLANLFYIVIGTHKEKGNTMYDVISSRYERTSFTEEKVKTLLDLSLIHILHGDSATGKSLLCTMLKSYINDNNNASFKPYNADNIFIVSKDNKDKLSLQKGKLIIIDRAELILDEQMVEIINADRGYNRYLIFLRKPMGIELSPNYFGTLCKKDGELQLEYECYVRGWA